MDEIFRPRIGILGGAFDPPHSSHIDMAHALMLERGYDKLVFLPSGNPPHKILSTDGEHRYNMLCLVAPHGAEVSRIELDYDGIGYTCDYLPRLKAVYGEDIEYIIGGDSMLSFDHWYRPLDILRQVHILVVSRDGQRDLCREAISHYDNVEKLGIILSDFTPRSMSSTAIRDKLRLHLPVGDELDSRVYEYICEHNLYDEYADIHARLTKTISEERYRHSVRTAEFALQHYRRFGLDYDKVARCALLHDCAKCPLDIDSLREYALSHCPQYWREDAVHTPVGHAFMGAVVAMRDYGVTDSAILDAIAYHTTARPDMTPLDELIYTADLLEAGRDYDDVDELRREFDRDAHVGFLATLHAGYKHLLEVGNPIYPLTAEAYRYYIEEKR